MKRFRKRTIDLTKTCPYCVRSKVKEVGEWVTENTGVYTTRQYWDFHHWQCCYCDMTWSLLYPPISPDPCSKCGAHFGREDITESSLRGFPDEDKCKQDEGTIVGWLCENCNHKWLLPEYENDPEYQRLLNAEPTPDPANLPWVSQIVKPPSKQTNKVNTVTKLKQEDQQTMTNKDNDLHLPSPDYKTHANGKTYAYHREKPNGPSRQCPECGWYMSNNVKGCKCGYDWPPKDKSKRKSKRKTSQPAQQPDTPTKSQPLDNSIDDLEQSYRDKSDSILEVLDALLTLTNPDYTGNAIYIIRQALEIPDVGAFAIDRIGERLLG